MKNTWGNKMVVLEGQVGELLVSEKYYKHEDLQSTNIQKRQMAYKKISAQKIEDMRNL